MTHRRAGIWIACVALIATLAELGSARDAAAPPDAALLAADAALRDVTREDAGTADRAIGDAAFEAAPDAARLEDAGLEAATAAGSDAAEPPDASLDAEPGTVAPAPTESETRPDPVAPSERPNLALKSVIGLLAILVLAWLGNHRRVRELQETLRVRSAITAGFPFLLLGLVARQPSVGVLTEQVLAALRPLIEFGLGWLGFVVGYRFDLRKVDKLPSGAGIVVSLGTALPFATIAIACGAVMAALGLMWSDDALLRSAFVLGTAGAMTAPPMNDEHTDTSASGKTAWLLDEVVGIAGLALLAAYFRPPALDASWALPGTAWLFLTLGMGVTLGVVLHVILLRPATRAEFIAITLGCVSFAAGMAAYVGLSPIVICSVAGVVVANLPSLHRDVLGETVKYLERPIFLVFLVMAGAIWDPRDWHGWALAPVFVASRYLGVWLGRKLGALREPEAAAQIHSHSLWMSPLSLVAIAVTVNVSTLYSGQNLSLMLTAVISAAILAEIISALAVRRDAGKGSA